MADERQTLRRQDDVVLQEIDKRLALLEQATKMERERADARSAAHDRAIDTLSVKVDAAITLWNNVVAEPAASPAGRALATDISEMRRDVDNNTGRISDLIKFRDEIRGSVQMLRLMSVVLGGIASILGIIATWAALGRPTV